MGKGIGVSRGRKSKTKQYLDVFFVILTQTVLICNAAKGDGCIALKPSAVWMPSALWLEKQTSHTRKNVKNSDSIANSWSDV